MTYTIEEKNLERQHLLAEYLAPLSLHALSDITLQSGARVLDLGCGLGDTSLMLSRQFPRTSVTGIDQDGTLIEAARAMNIAQGTNMQFEQGNALQLPFPADSFDLVFTRYLVCHIPNPLAVFEEMKRVCRPGGIIFAQEPDLHFMQSYPESWAYPKLVELSNLLFADALLGRKLISYFNALQLEKVEYKAEVIFGPGHHALKRFLTLTAEALRPAGLKKDLLGEEKFDELILECWRLEQDQHTTILSHPTIAVWGRKSF